MMMTKDAYAEITKLVEDSAPAGHDRAALTVEKFCASKQVEYHPLACDLVEAAFTPKKELADPAKGPRKCAHVPTATRDAADEWLDANSKPEANKPE